DSYTGVKVVSSVPGDPAGIVAVFDESGHPLGLVDGPTLSAIRTAAAPGLATDRMAAPDACVLAMLGAGAMAADQVAAVRAVRPIREVLVWSRTEASARALADSVGGQVVPDADEAVARADVVSTATPSRAPLFDSSSLRPGTHVNAVGAFTPEMVEIPGEVVEQAFVVVDDREAAAVEAGDLLRVDREPDADMADLIGGRVAPSGQPFTLFKSVGIASQDIAAAVMALTNAEQQDLGTVL
ncbi:MAG: NAD(P)-binding domain-containing protein, partial [Acidimicrobiales bacterium]|nr:NAD(P)-binding domain-containing protein [Acidimicrobiales bacterium]